MTWPLSNDKSLLGLSVYYEACTYSSHARAAKGYIELLRPRVTIVSSAHDADIVILHREPREQYCPVVKALRRKGKYVVGYCVWEADRLPQPYTKYVQCLDEVWTSSLYSQLALDQGNPHTYVIPHVCDRDTTFARDDLDSIRRRLNAKGDETYFLTVTKLRDPRKNTKQLRHAFLELTERMPNAILIVKGLPGDPSLEYAHPGIRIITDLLTEAEMNALYAVSHVYVSAHHAEAWGFTLADAMLFRKPVVAPGYSGNLSYMTEDNSFLIPAVEAHIKRRDTTFLFQEGMKWGYPNMESLKQTIWFLYQHHRSVEVLRRAEVAHESIKRFSPEYVWSFIEERLSRIASLHESMQTSSADHTVRSHCS